jgi:hypothetical protein
LVCGLFIPLKTRLRDCFRSALLRHGYVKTTRMHAHNPSRLTIIPPRGRGAGPGSS